jgi:Reverse transcriptase (RNA-dependent DNA polymerase)
MHYHGPHHAHTINCGFVQDHNLTKFDDDASACYDRIIVALGMLAARRCGMPPNAIRLHSEALQFMKYTIKAVHGISEKNFAGTPFEPRLGTGQGSGTSPVVWLTLVVLLLHTLDRLVPDRMHFESLSGARTHSRTADAFVDDTSIGFTSSSDEKPYENLIARLQTVAQTLEHLLHLSGWKLNLNKCSWYIVRLDWNKGRPILRKALPSDAQLTLCQGNNADPAPIPQRSPEMSSKMLGVHLNPLGDFSDHIRCLRAKADE